LATDQYYTIAGDSVKEFTDRGSRFIAYACPISNADEFKQKLAAIKEIHPKASHHCFAYRLGVNDTVFRVSDDGEPSGTAGRPILGQIDSKQLTNVLVIVVRYFGGTLLGVPGLIHAYKSTAALALQSSEIITRQVLVTYQLQFDYTRMNDVMRLIKQYECSIMKRDIQLFCQIEAGIPKKNVEELLNKLNQLKGVEVGLKAKS
jgi:uncharacterized YigZ family protein